MTIAVFGATGIIGKAFIETALSHRHKIRALARFSASVDIILHNTKLIKGEIFDPAAVGRVLMGADAVVLVVGLKKNKTLPLYSLGTATIIEEMKARCLKRLIVVSETNYGVHIHPHNFLNKFSYLIQKKLGVHAVEERLSQDELIKNSLIDYVIIRPNRLIVSNSQQQPAYSFEPLKNKRKVSIRSLCGLMIQLLENPEELPGRNIYL